MTVPEPSTQLARIEGNTVLATFNGVERRLRIDGDRAVVMLGNEEASVRVEGGFITKVMRNVKLEYGPDLYCAAKNPGETDKVMPYGPGYAKLVAGMGGQCKCPPAILDPTTNTWQPNPRVETYPGTAIIRSVTATAVCVVPNPSTGQLTASVQTLTVDAEHVLRQALLKIDREDSVRILSEEEVVEERKTGGLKGWTVIPLTPPYAMIAANMKMAPVREAFQTFQNQSATIRQRACTKAERLACDHNPITRMVWEFGSLTLVWGKDREGKEVQVAAPYKLVPVIAWIRHEGQEGIEKLMASLASTDDAMGVEQVVRGHEIIDAEDTDPDDALDPDVPRLERTPDEPAVPARKAVAVRAEPAPVVEEKAASKVASQPSQSETPPANGRLDRAWGRLTEAQREQAWASCGFPATLVTHDPSVLDEAAKKKLLAACMDLI